MASQPPRIRGWTGTSPFENPKREQSNLFCIKSKLFTTATFKTPKKWLLYKGCRSVEVVQSNLVSKLAWLDLVWLLFTSGYCSKVNVNTGLNVYCNHNSFISINLIFFLVYLKVLTTCSTNIPLCWLVLIEIVQSDLY